MKTQENKLAELLIIKDLVERRISYTITSDIEYHAKQLLIALGKFHEAAQKEGLQEPEIKELARYYELKGEKAAIEELD